MKNYLRFLSPVMLLLMAVMFGGGKILAQTSVSLTLSKDVKFGTKSGSTLTQNSVTWKVTTKSGSIQNSYQSSYNGQQFGVSGTPWKGTFSTSDIVGKITKVAVAANTGGSANLSVKVGNTDFLCSKKSTADVIKNTKGINTYTFEGNATGDVVISLNGSSKACYLGGITVTYNEADAKTPTTLSFENKESVITYSVGDGEDGNVTLTNTAILNPSVANSNITYSLSNNTFDANEILIDNDGTVIFSTKKEASATITASYAGNDTYAASTASYTIKVVDPNSVVVFSDKNNSFANISKLPGGQGYKKGTINFVDGNGVGYSFSITNCMLDKQRLQMQKTSTNGGGIIISPVLGYMYGYKIIVTYVSKDEMTLIAGDKTVTGTNGVLTLTTASDINFTLRTGKEVSYVTSIAITPNTAPETLTTSAGGYATYSADYAVNYSELGLTAYTLTVDETNKTVTAKAFTGVVPAGKAVLVKGDASKAYTLTPATTEGDATFATDLMTGATKADGTQYGFTTKFGTPAFAQVKSGQDIPAKKGYIVLNGASAAKYSICFDDEATGIHTIEAASAANAAMYNLAGQRVDKAYKGIVIVNGKKYLNK